MADLPRASAGGTVIVDEAPVQQPPSIPHAGKRHIPALDGVRGLAAIAVFFFHYGDLSHSSWGLLRFANEVKLRGAYGVDIFFALSGFLITGILWDMRNANHRWLNFYRNRALRLFPLYYGLWVFLAFYCIVFHHPWYRSNFAYLLYGGNFVYPFGALNQIGLFGVSHLWSLACEEQFYMIWPVLVWRIGKIETLKRIAMIAFFASLALKMLALGLHIDARWSYVMLPLRMEGLCAGAYCALALRTHPEETVRVGRRLFWILCPAMVAFFMTSALLPLNYKVEHLFAFALVGSVGAALIAIAIDPESFSSRFFSTRVLRIAGKYSYGIYVYSVFLHTTLKTYLLPRVVRTFHGGITADVVYLVMVMCLVMLLCLASFHLLEQPFLKLKRHRSPA
ncbi:MAG TPA: acyltransferase [Acidobacteriaceae bacterium]